MFHLVRHCFIKRNNTSPIQNQIGKIEEENTKILANNPADGHMETAVERSISPDDIYSLDTNRVAPEVKDEELKKIKKQILRI